MSDALTIVAYHYVRDLKKSRFPDIKGLSIEQFTYQLNHIAQRYNVISANDLMTHIVDDAPLPKNPLLLTFDDGYADHYTVVFPILNKLKMPGCFFPSAKCVMENAILNINKIHFILASVKDKQLIVDYMFRMIQENKARYELLDVEEYWELWARPTRFDIPQVVFIKRLLQRELPMELRVRMADELFAQYVYSDTRAFSRELYMSFDQAEMMQRNGMYIGSHGYDHYWLDRVSARQQEFEIDKSLTFLESVGSDVSRWTMCYPHGAYNQSLLDILRARNCVAGLTVEPEVATDIKKNALLLPRIDTNDLPKHAEA